MPGKQTITENPRSEQAARAERAGRRPGGPGLRHEQKSFEENEFATDARDKKRPPGRAAGQAEEVEGDAGEAGIHTSFLSNGPAL
jgi:hypothetical protein